MDGLICCTCLTQTDTVLCCDGNLAIRAVTVRRLWFAGFDGTPQTTGQKCLLCKRDLSFKPEGPVYQPTVPPPVAVLPCGHTFHDHCLQIITPEDQSKNPPCIPCAIGEI
uniref:RING-type domain-containing protein n=1 Tax=Davidia involucrata TaxID=16924 RepID=A0A5B7C1A5_DAVIN